MFSNLKTFPFLATEKYGFYKCFYAVCFETFMFILLFFVCRKVSFVAYNALAAGLLTGKHSKGRAVGGGSEQVLEGRFKNNPNYLPRFYTDANFRAVRKTPPSFFVSVLVVLFVLL